MVSRLESPSAVQAVGVGAGPRVDAQAADGGHVQRAVGGAVAAAVETVALGLPGGGGQRRGAAEHREAGSLRSRSGLSPAVTSRLAGDLDAEPTRSTRRGSSSSTSGVMSSSSSAISSESSRMRRARLRNAIRVAAVGSRNAIMSGLEAASAGSAACGFGDTADWSRTSSGAATMVLRSCCSVARRALTAVCAWCAARAAPRCARRAAWPAGSAGLPAPLGRQPPRRSRRPCRARDAGPCRVR